MYYDEQQNIKIRYKVTRNDKALYAKLNWFQKQKGLELIPFDTTEDRTIPLLKISRKGAFLETDQDRFFFHPNMLLLRMMNCIKGSQDRFLEAVNLRAGESIIDATMGLASDTLVAAWAAGEKGRVVALERSPIVYALVADGLHTLKHHPYQLNTSNPEKIRAWEEIIQASYMIEPRLANHEEYLAELPDSSFDIIYFDPMFQRSKEESSSIKSIKTWSHEEPIKAQTIREACRVARKRVVLKERKNSAEFTRLGFTTVPGGKYSSIDFGIIDLNAEE